MRSLTEIRSTFIKYFVDNEHEHVQSSPLVPLNDPTLLFTNAGMVQFKDLFTGLEQRDYKRAVTSQKCLRAGGKHNDLENVGYTSRHHTFFEMLGNFSFGDYFKEQAIVLAWELLTKHYDLSPERLLVTVYSEDEEAAGIWKKLTNFSDDKIIRIPTSDNFWSMGDTGPCGPCSEIFFDHGDKVAGGPPGSPDEDGDRFTEIWNLVFMQFEQHAGGNRTNLPKPSIDTGMGLERIATVLQGIHNNYETDLFQALIHASQELTENDNQDSINSHRVISDHLRASSFLIADGVLPTNEGRGYVLRRIMRRAMRHAHILGSKEPLMYRLVPTLIEQMGQAYPELNRAKALIEETLKSEEEKFQETLGRGLKLLTEETQSLKSGDMFSGDVAFKLYDTYGFPVDLTQDVLKAQDIQVDESAFNAAMEEQRARARAAWVGSGDAQNEQVWYDIHQRVGATEFLGYETAQAEGVVQAIVKGGAEVEIAQEGDELYLVVNQTPFYAESGGQMGDHGTLVSTDAKLQVTDTAKKVGALHAHKCKLIKGTLKAGDTVKLSVDSTRRDLLRMNHSATHLLHAALRKVLGEHVTQKGSLVAPDRLRFDFAHKKPLSSDETAEIERLVNVQIQKNVETATRLMSPEDAVEQGALALFGERYGDEVRVVSFGDEGDKYSTELCGGTHVRRTGDIGLLKIIAEEGVSSGVRRIEALTGNQALNHMIDQERILDALSASAKAPQHQLAEKVSNLIKDKRDLEKQVADLRKKVALSGKGESKEEADEVQQVGSFAVVTKTLQDIPAKDLKSLADTLKARVKSGVALVFGENEGKVSIVVGVTDDITDKVSAVDLVRLGSETVGGKGGGGRPDLAQAGGTEPNHIPEAIKKIHDHIKSL